jgi:hypothetical protein
VRGDAYVHISEGVSRRAPALPALIETHHHHQQQFGAHTSPHDETSPTFHTNQTRSVLNTMNAMNNDSLYYTIPLLLLHAIEQLNIEINIVGCWLAGRLLIKTPAVTSHDAPGLDDRSSRPSYIVL